MNTGDGLGRSVSIIDIAEETGVSRSAVSRALNNQPGVNPAVREKVKQAAARLGYVKDFRATALKTQHTRTIGLLVRVQQLASYAAFIAALQHEVAQQSYRLAVVTQNEAPKEAWQFLLGLRPEGVVVASSRLEDELLLATARRLPVVATSPQRLDQVGTVGFGTRAAADLVRAVTRSGHDAVALLTCPESRTLSARSEALAEELHSRQVKVVEVPVLDDEPNPEELRQALPQVTAVMAPSDELALAVWQLCDQQETPVAVTGFGGSTNARVLGLTTVDFPVAEAAKLAAAQVLERIADPTQPAKHVLLEGQLVAGRSLTSPQQAFREGQRTVPVRRIGAW